MPNYLHIKQNTEAMSVLSIVFQMMNVSCLFPWLSLRKSQQFVDSPQNYST